MDERLLSRIWRAQRFDLAALRTTRGDAVEIVYRGRAHRAPGPDYRDAAVLVGGELLYGDVEVHVRSAGWAQHRHDRDRRYDGVILHVVARDDATQPVRTSRGREVPCVELGDRIGGANEWASLALPVLPDCVARLATLDDDELGARLDRLGDARLVLKAAEIETELLVVDAEQVLYERLLEALGYGENRRAFCDLARRLPIASLFALTHRLGADDRRLVVEALLFGVAGLLPSRREPSHVLDWSSAAHADDLEAAWDLVGAEWRDEIMRAADWTFGVRPLNSPPRRLAALAVFLADHMPEGLVSVNRRALLSGERGRRIANPLVVSEPDSYWAGYFDFGRPLSPPAAALLGRERALVTVVNVFLPFGLAAGEPDLAGAARAAFNSVPRLAPDEVTRWMLAEVVGAGRAGLVDSARRQQGLHHLYRLGCDLAACEACPLFEPRLHQALPDSRPPST